MKAIHILAILSILLLTSCSSMNKAQVGGVGGAGAGAIIGQAIGHNTEATLIGMAVGGMLGYIVGNEMDKYDRQQLNHVYERGVSGQTSSWVNPDKGTQYRVTPQPAYTASNNQVCRKAEVTAIIDGKAEKTYTTACRDDYGQWQLQQ